MNIRIPWPPADNDSVSDRDVLSWLDSMNIECNIERNSIVFHHERDALMFRLRFGF